MIDSMWVAAALIVLATGCGRINFSTDAPWLPGYAHRKRITLTPPTTTTLADFTVAILEPADPELAAFAAQDGADVTFTARDGTTRLPRELAAFDPGTG